MPRALDGPGRPVGPALVPALVPGVLSRGCFFQGMFWSSWEVRRGLALARRIINLANVRLRVAQPLTPTLSQRERESGSSPVCPAVGGRLKGGPGGEQSYLRLKMPRRNSAEPAQVGFITIPVDCGLQTVDCKLSSVDSYNTLTSCAPDSSFPAEVMRINSAFTHSSPRLVAPA